MLHMEKLRRSPRKKVTEGNEKGRRKLDFHKDERKRRDVLRGFRVFVDIQVQGKADVIKKRIASLGGVVEEFLDKKINLIVTSQKIVMPTDKDGFVIQSIESPMSATQPSPLQIFSNKQSIGRSPYSTDSPQNSVDGARRERPQIETLGKKLISRALSTKKGAGAPNISQRAKQLNARIWSVEDFDKRYGPRTSGSNIKLLREKPLQKLKKTSPRTVSEAQVIKSSEPFFKIEDINRCFRPIVYEPKSWPALYCSTTLYQSPFDVPREKTHDRTKTVGDADCEVLDEETMSLINKSEKEYHEDQQNNKISKKQRKEEFLSPDKQSTLKTKKHKKDIEKPGYCDICSVRYKELKKHLRNEQHRKFVTNKSNYEKLDELINQCKPFREFIDGMRVSAKVSKLDVSPVDVNNTIVRRFAKDESFDRDIFEDSDKENVVYTSPAKVVITTMDQKVCASPCKKVSFGEETIPVDLNLNDENKMNANSSCASPTYCEEDIIPSVENVVPVSRRSATVNLFAEIDSIPKNVITSDEEKASAEVRIKDNQRNCLDKMLSRTQDNDDDIVENLSVTPQTKPSESPVVRRTHRRHRRNRLQTLSSNSQLESQHVEVTNNRDNSHKHNDSEYISILEEELPFPPQQRIINPRSLRMVIRVNKSSMHSGETSTDCLYSPVMSSRDKNISRITGDKLYNEDGKALDSDPEIVFNINSNPVLQRYVFPDHNHVDLKTCDDSLAHNLTINGSKACDQINDYSETRDQVNDDLLNSFVPFPSPIRNNNWQKDEKLTCSTPFPVSKDCSVSSIHGVSVPGGLEKILSRDDENTIQNTVVDSKDSCTVDKCTHIDFSDDDGIDVSHIVRISDGLKIGEFQNVDDISGAILKHGSTPESKLKTPSIEKMVTPNSKTKKQRRTSFDVDCDLPCKRNLRSMNNPCNRRSAFNEAINIISTSSPGSLVSNKSPVASHRHCNPKKRRATTPSTERFRKRSRTDTTSTSEGASHCDLPIKEKIDFIDANKLDEVFDDFLPTSACQRITDAKPGANRKQKNEEKEMRNQVDSVVLQERCTTSTTTTTSDDAIKERSPSMVRRKSVPVTGMLYDRIKECPRRTSNLASQSFSRSSSRPSSPTIKEKKKTKHVAMVTEGDLKSGAKSLGKLPEKNSTTSVKPPQTIIETQPAFVSIQSTDEHCAVDNELDVSDSHQFHSKDISNLNNKSFNQRKKPSPFSKVKTKQNKKAFRQENDTSYEVFDFSTNDDEQYSDTMSISFQKKKKSSAKYYFVSESSSHLDNNIRNSSIHSNAATVNSSLETTNHSPAKKITSHSPAKKTTNHSPAKKTTRRSRNRTNRVCYIESDDDVECESFFTSKKKNKSSRRKNHIDKWQ